MSSQGNQQSLELQNLKPSSSRDEDESDQWFEIENNSNGDTISRHSIGNDSFLTPSSFHSLNDDNQFITEEQLIKGPTTTLNGQIKPLRDNSKEAINSIRKPTRIAKIYNCMISWTPQEKTHKIFIYFLTPILFSITTYLICGPITLPGGSIFPLIVLEFGGIALGIAFSALRLPPLLGMLCMGLLIRNVPFIDFGKSLSPYISSPLRQIALIIILTRAGLGLDPKALLKLSWVVVRLAFTPCLVEAFATGISAHLILGIPFSWGLILGFVIAAVSPAVVVPCLLNLRDRGYGTDKGIPTTVIAAASVDDVLAISCFGFMLSFAFSRNDVWSTILQGPLEVIFGIGYGIFWGGLLGIFLSVDNPKDNKVLTFMRVFFLLAIGALAVFGFQNLDYPGAGCLGSLCATFVASLIWRKKGQLYDNDNLNWSFSVLWYIFQPLLFGLIGCELDLNFIETKVVGWGILCLCIGIIFRLVASYLAVHWSDLNTKEKLFVCIAWLPKATVQAAIGPVALDIARKTGAGIEAEGLGLTVLTIAVLSILITAPLGATLVMLLGPKLLNQDKTNQLTSQNP